MEPTGSAPPVGKRERERVQSAASGWRLPRHKGRVVVVPVRFFPPGTSGERWIRTVGVPINVPGWVVAEQSSVGLLTLGDGGSASSERWKLIATPES